MTNDEDKKWGTPQEWGIMKLRYKPTGEVKEIQLGIRRMDYHNELILCKSWGYDGGNPTDQNNPDNWELISIDGTHCLDKSQVKEVIKKHFVHAYTGDGTVHSSGCRMCKVLKELEL